MNFNEFLKEKLKEKIDNIEEIISEAEKNKISIEEYLYRYGLLDDYFLNLKSTFFNLPIKNFSLEEQIPAEILNLISEDFSKQRKVISFDKKDDGIYVGVVNPESPSLTETINYLKSIYNQEIKPYIISLKDYFLIFRQYHKFSETLKEILFSLRKAKPLITQAEIVKLEEEILPTEEAPIIKLVQSLIEEAVYLQASDIHIEPLSRKLKIRFRLLGDLKNIAYLPKDLHQQIVNRIKVLAKLKLDESRIPQDGRIRIFVHGREIDLRIGIFPTVEGEKVAIRILDPLVGLKKISELGILHYTEDKLNTAIKSPYGLILITGPTGSGKTTTLYAVLQSLNNEKINIISLEDPVEYRLEGINQSQVRPEINYTFASGLRSILRQDPDIILVGEIRDSETAELSIHASLTGHLVLSTLHTNNSIGAISRLIDLGVQKFLLPETIRIVIAQRLAKKLCEFCRKEFSPSEEIKKIILENLGDIDKNILSELKINFSNLKTYHPNGCEKCNFRGYSGRSGIFEVFLMTDEIKSLIYEGKPLEELENKLKDQNFINLRQDGIIKALLGIFTIEEVLKIT
ncbi:MAG: GspE/PulE family protein [Patescibacteria group bacterium]|nr:GspE/PulE family protein [Patescibacteria group bacterium]